MSKKTKPIMLGKEKVSQSLQATILIRAFKEKEFISLWEAYKNARLRNSMETKEPTEQMRKIAAMRKTGATLREIGQKFNVPLHQVAAAIHRVALHQFLNS